MAWQAWQSRAKSYRGFRSAAGIMTPAGDFWFDCDVVGTGEASLAPTGSPSSSVAADFVFAAGDPRVAPTEEARSA